VYVLYDAIRIAPANFASSHGLSLDSLLFRLIESTKDKTFVPAEKGPTFRWGPSTYYLPTLAKNQPAKVGVASTGVAGAGATAGAAVAGAAVGAAAAALVVSGAATGL
jgi:hypothetical protein